jgi:hypothetical protein
LNAPPWWLILSSVSCILAPKSQLIAWP